MHEQFWVYILNLRSDSSNKLNYCPCWLYPHKNMTYQIFDKTHPAKSNKGPSETQFFLAISATKYSWIAWTILRCFKQQNTESPWKC